VEALVIILFLTPFALAWAIWRIVQLQKVLKPLKAVTDAQAEAKRVIADAEAQSAAVWSESASKVKALGAEQATLTADTTRLRQERDDLECQVSKLKADVESLNLNEYAKEFGIYQPTYNFDGVEKYKLELDRLYEREKQMLKDGNAARCDTEWAVEGSAAKGRRMIEQQLKLMLMAFNGEADSLIAKVRFDNVLKVEDSIRKAFERINKLGKEKHAYITDAYLDLKLKEVRLAYEFQERKQQEVEEQRAIREQMREEERARRELERAQLEAEREAERYAKALEKAQAEAERTTGAKYEKMLLEIEQLKARLAEATANRERAKSQAELTRSGYVYVISNLGSFGENVYKIGMTRRLDPMDRVVELSDASVPFPFDVHAMIYSEDAPGLENALHRTFHYRRLNLVNLKKEFFRVTLDEITVIAKQHRADVHFTLAAEAAEWRKSEVMRQQPNTNVQSVVE
jgi:regulator of protease activity HflC (stomatin/prohibitin superfamily)